jgi:hypothetical protein
MTCNESRNVVEYDGKSVSEMKAHIPGVRCTQQNQDLEVTGQTRPGAGGGRC